MRISDWSSDVGSSDLDPHVETISGDRVNVLAPGEEYVYAYAVDSERTLGRVRCGMLIRSVIVVELAVAATSTAVNAIGLVELVSTLAVRLRFRCLLVPGESVVTAGVIGALEHGADSLARRVYWALLPR